MTSLEPWPSPRTRLHTRPETVWVLWTSCTVIVYVRFTPLPHSTSICNLFEIALFIFPVKTFDLSSSIHHTWWITNYFLFLQIKSKVTFLWIATGHFQSRNRIYGFRSTFSASDWSHWTHVHKAVQNLNHKDLISLLLSLGTLFWRLGEMLLFWQNGVLVMPWRPEEVCGTYVDQMTLQNSKDMSKHYDIGTEHVSLMSCYGVFLSLSMRWE